MNNERVASELVKLAKSLVAGLDVFDKRQVDIAIKTLRMPDAILNVMGGMSKQEARAILKKMGYPDSKIRRLEASERMAKDGPKDIERMAKSAVAMGKTLEANLKAAAREMTKSEVQNAIHGLSNAVKQLENDIARLERIKGELD